MINIIYYSETGNTEAMAEAIRDGVEAVGKEANLISFDDATIDDVKDAEAVAFGCPAKGDEELEESTVRPFMDEAYVEIKDKKVALFGSYSWNEGEWMNKWKEEVEATGCDLIDALAGYDYPDEDVIKACKALGEKLAK